MNDPDYYEVMYTTRGMNDPDYDPEGDDFIPYIPEEEEEIDDCDLNFIIYAPMNTANPHKHLPQIEYDYDGGRMHHCKMTEKEILSYSFPPYNGEDSWTNSKHRYRVY